MTLRELATRLQGVRWSGDRAFTAYCPAHPNTDTQAFSVTLADDARLLVHCHTGCDFESIAGSLNLQKKDFFPPKPDKIRHSTAEKPITLGQLANIKKFDVAWLQDHGVDDFPDGRGIAIGYFLENDHQAPRIRLRTAAKAGKGSAWVGKGDLVPYGLWLFAEARARRFLVVVEGETDCWALWLHGWPALGLPGATNISCLKAEHLRGLDKIYVVQESDKAGAGFPSHVLRRCREVGFTGDIFALQMPSGAKDPCDLHIAGTFDQEFLWAVENAQPIELLAVPQVRRVDCNIAGSDLEVRTQATFEAITQANTGPDLFLNTTELMLLQGTAGVPADLLRLRQWLTAHINFQTFDRQGNLMPTLPNEPLLQNLQVYYPSPLPHLTRIVRRPVLTADGRMLLKSGYDRTSGLVYLPSRALEGLEPSVDVQRALDLIADLFVDFYFETPSDRAHFYAFLLQPMFREMMPGPTPIYRFEAPVPGTGKGRLFEVGSMLLGGHTFTTPRENEEEWGKSLITHLRVNPEILLLDNCHNLSSSNLAAAVTAWPTWTARWLSTLDQITVSVRTMWAATINNPQLNEEIYRRSVRIRITPGGIENPYLRTNFRHDPILNYALSNLRELVGALVTIAMFGQRTMRPFTARRLGSFENWARVMGGVLEAIGVEGFIAPIEGDMAKSQEERAWQGFIDIWHQRFADQWMQCRDLFVAAQDSEIDLGNGSERSQQTCLGKKLALYRGRTLGDFILEAKHLNGKTRYRLKG